LRPKEKGNTSKKHKRRPGGKNQDERLNFVICLEPLKRINIIGRKKKKALNGILETTRKKREFLAVR